MTPYTLLHLALAGAFFVLGLLHFATWAAVRSQRVQLWLALSFVGFAVVALASGLTGRAASTMTSDPRPWLLLGVLPSVFLPYTLLRVLWSLLDRPLTRWRNVMLAAAIAVGSVRVIDATWAILRPWMSPSTTEQAPQQATAGLALALFWLLAACVAGTWAVEAVRSLKDRGAMAAAVLTAAILALALLCRELAVDLGWVAGPSLFALVGLPFLLLASTALAILTARSLRGADLGTGIHRYRRLARLGRGGMGEVWLAVRTGRAGFHRLVVLKRMLDEGGDDPAVMLQRFIGEARTAARLHHPNIVSVYDLGQIDGGWFIVMEYLSGVNVLEFVRRVERGGQLPLEVIIEVGQQALRGLAYAHERGVIHRDISADNLVVSFDGVVKVVDFGIAHGVGEAQEPRAPNAPVRARAPVTSRLTEVGSVIGKPGYMPPERVEGNDATASGDLFALGCILHELLFGMLPEVSPDGVVYPKRERPEAPAAYQQLLDVLDIALNYRAERRFADAKEFLLRLEPVRHALPTVDLTEWVREHFAERWKRERTLSELNDPSSLEVEALLSRVVPAAPPVMDQVATRIVDAKAGRTPEDRQGEQKTEQFTPRR